MSEKLHPEEAITTFVLIRHGHTAQTEAGKLYSDPAAALTDKGREDAASIARWIPREKPDVLICGPSVRVQATAKAVSDITKLPIEIDDKLTEWQVGDWEGRSYVEIKKAEPAIYEAWSKDPIRNAPPRGESISSLCVRVKVELKNLIESHRGRCVAVVTHAEVIRAIMVDALGLPVENFWRLMVPTASVAKIDFSEHFATVHYFGVRADLIEPVLI